MAVAKNGQSARGDGKSPVPAVKARPTDPVAIGLDTPLYTLSVAAELLDTHSRTLMMYEHLGLIKPRRTATNRRRYTQRDLLKLRAIQTLTRQHGVNLAGARYILPMLKTLRQAGLEAPEALADVEVAELDV
ncbi:MAG: MerR family transcriptional regulator [Streptomyces sp.]|jgi:MerR family transcriptional regulator/heat shock protein HspR|nr:MerR family transcriptional regulator [Streptomyces sp.]